MTTPTDNNKEFVTDTVSVTDSESEVEEFINLDQIRLNKQIVDQNARICELEKELKELKDTIVKQQSDELLKKEHAKQLRTEKVSKYVDEMLKDASINIEYFPDYIERKIYRNVFNLVLNLMDHVLETTELKLFGNELQITIN